MDLTHLQTFVVTVDAGSFTDAAARLGLSKSTVSVHISELEESLGLHLLHRTTQRFRLTARGDELYRRVHLVHPERHFVPLKMREVAAAVRGALGQLSVE